MLHYILTDLQDTAAHIPVSIAAGVLALALCVFINRYFCKNLPCGSGFLLCAALHLIRIKQLRLG